MQTQTTELDKVKAKIHALSQKTISNGCTEGEAMLAMEKVGELLEAYQLNMSEVVLRDAECVEVTWETKRRSRHPMDISFVGVSAFCNCKMWVTRDKNYKFFGFVEDTKMAMYLMDVIAQAYETELAKFKKSDYYRNSHQHGRILTTNFYKGMASHLQDRLLDMKNERNAREYENQKTKSICDHKSTDLILMKKQKVEDEWEKRDIKLVRHYGNRYRSDFNARSAGRKAGQNVNLNRPINSGGSGPAGYLS